LGAYVRAGKQEEVESLELQAEALSEAVEREVALLKAKSGMRALDLGCGTVDVAGRIVEQVDFWRQLTNFL
jgi:ubiquinone/menaquinone biosynthesis C-methylase UbiE